MRMKTKKALLFCSFTIVLLLGVVGIASAARPVMDSSCDCECVMSDFSPPFCWGTHPKDFDPGWAKGAAECLVACLRGIPYSCLT